MLILDSNIISYYLRGDPQIVPRVQALAPAEVGVPAIVEYEYAMAFCVCRRRPLSLGWQR